jgi:hypothetical protein
MVFSVLVLTDPAGESPVILRDEASPGAELSNRWRFIATTDDRGEALRWLELLREECRSADKLKAGEARNPQL